MSVFTTLRSDFQAVKDRDPAYPGGIRGIMEILLCYPGIHAIVCHRLLHFLHSGLRIPVLPRFLGHFVRWWTGIEIHPGATIGKGVFIDHGMGVVIGETAVVGNGVTLYQGVTLGGTGKEKGKRHPTVDAGALIGCGATVLGNIRIGENARVGAGSVVVKDVKPDSTVVGIPSSEVNSATRSRSHPSTKLDHQDISDPVRNYLKELEERLAFLENTLKDMTEADNKVEVA